LYRETFTGTTKFVESLSPQPHSKKIIPGKIHPHSESEILLVTLKTYDCYCFGRFATWRPDELAHETWQQIEEWKESML
jgi:hypothetical protein